MGEYTIRKVCFFGPKKMRFMRTESILQTKIDLDRQKIGFL